MQPKIYYSIHVRGYESKALTYQVYHDEVYVSQTGRFSGPKRQKKFDSFAAAERYIETRKDKNVYKFQVVKITSWE